MMGLATPDSRVCHADADGDCIWQGCPQLRDHEPKTSGRHCPLDNQGDPADDDDHDGLARDIRERHYATELTD